MVKEKMIPEIRFKGFEDEWEKSKLQETSKIVKGKQLNKEDVVEEGKYYHLNGGINPSNRTNLYNTEANTISISEGGNSYGYVNWNSEPFYSGGHNYTLDVKKLNNLFLYQFLKSRELDIIRLRVGSGLPNIQKKDIETFRILYPSLKEQEKISQFFQSIDQKIQAEEEKLENYKKLKKALLQKMFI